MQLTSFPSVFAIHLLGIQVPAWSRGASRSSALELGQARSWSEQPTRLLAIPSPQPNERGVLTWKQGSDLLPPHIKAHLTGIQ